MQHNKIWINETLHQLGHERNLFEWILVLVLDNDGVAFNWQITDSGTYLEIIVDVLLNVFVRSPFADHEFVLENLLKKLEGGEKVLFAEHVGSTFTSLGFRFQEQQGLSHGWFNEKRLGDDIGVLGKLESFKNWILVLEINDSFAILGIELADHFKIQFLDGLIDFPIAWRIWKISLLALFSN